MAYFRLCLDLKCLIILQNISKETGSMPARFKDVLLILLLLISGYLAVTVMIAVPAFRSEPIPEGYILAQLDARISALVYTKEAIDQRIGVAPEFSFKESLYEVIPTMEISSTFDDSPITGSIFENQARFKEVLSRPFDDWGRLQKSHLAEWSNYWPRSTQSFLDEQQRRKQAILDAYGELNVRRLGSRERVAHFGVLRSTFDDETAAAWQLLSECHRDLTSLRNRLQTIAADYAKEFLIIRDNQPVFC